jgi:hypothetical protein
MSSLFRSAAGTIARSTGTAMKPPGGETPASTRRLQPGHFGSKATHYRPFRKSQRQTVDGGHNPNRRRIFRIGSAMEEYRRRLERIQINICVVLTLALFGGLLILPRIGQIIWIAIIAAVYIRLTLVIARREELLEGLHPMREDDERTARYDASKRRIFLSESKGAWALDVDARAAQPADPCQPSIKRAAPGSYHVAIKRRPAPPSK